MSNVPGRKAYLPFGKMPRQAWMAGAAVLLFMVLGSIWMYRELLDNQVLSLDRHLQNVTSHVRADMVRGLEDQVRIQSRLSRRLEQGPDLAEANWRTDAHRLLEDYPFYRAMVLVNPDHRVRWLETRGPFPAQEGQPLAVMADRTSAREQDAEQGLGLSAIPIRLPDQQPAVLFLHPFDGVGNGPSWLAAVIVIPHALDHMVSAFHPADVNVRAHYRGTRVYPGPADEDHWSGSNWETSFVLPLAGDAMGMNVSVELSPEAISQLRSAVPETVLAAGLLLSLLMATAVMLAFGAAGQARVLARANRRLEDEIRDRELAEQELEFLATHDALTGLPNRTGISRFLEQRLPEVGESEQMAVLFIDLDQFKDINDTLGHHLGDQLLRQIPERLSRVLVEEDFVGRHGGDEFVIVATRRNRDQIQQLARNILESMDEGFALEGSRFFITGSIGIAFYPESGGSVSELIQNADAAVFRAKQAGRNQYALFSPELFGQVEYRLNLSRDIRQALEADQFRVEYQPIVSLEDFSLCGLEALLRWQHEKGYSVPPQEFIRIAEETGSIHRLSQFALRTALSDLADWRRLTDDPPWLAVNISGAQFREAGFVEQISVMLHKHRLDPSLVHLEITEQVLIENLTRNQRLLHELDKIGMRIVVDDFGVGYSSLAYLKNFPVSVVKIDQGFIRDLESDKEDQAITRTICTLSRDLGMQTIAEGVEYEAQLNLLRRFGCQLGQGFLFSRPVDATAVAEIVRGRLPWRDLLAVGDPP